MTHAMYAKGQYNHHAKIGLTCKTACGRRVKTTTLVPRGEQSCPSCQRQIDADNKARGPLMACPRACGVDIRDHHSTDEVNDGCDTGPMSLEEMTAWFEARGAGQPGFTTTAELIEEHYGKTETELDDIYAALHGSMA